MKKFKITKRQNRIYTILSRMFMAAVVVIILIGIQSVATNTSKKEKESLEKTLHRNIVECYALEGRYPESLEYIKDNYGLLYDDSKFYVDYQPVGENVMPDITIVVLD